MAGNERAGILAAGNWIVDHVKTIDRFPERETLCQIVAEHRGNGGAPYNVLVDLALMQAPFPLSAAGVVGDDQNGRSILEDCRKRGIDTAQLRVAPEASTSYTDVMSERDTGKRTFFHCRGANALMEEQDVEFAASTARIFHLGYLLLLDRLDAVGADGLTGSARLLRRASEAGCKTAVDVVTEVGPHVPAVVGPALPHIDYLIVNETEAGAITGRTTRGAAEPDRKEIQAAAGDLLRLGVREWVFIHFPEGAYAAGSNGESAWQQAVPVAPGSIAGTAGAGDAFAAGALFGLHEGWPLARILLLAAGAAACSLHHPTTSGGLRPWRDCLAAAGEELSENLPAPPS